MTIGASADTLLRNLTASREALKADGYDLAPSAFDARITELAELAPRIICPACGGRARGCTTCAVKNAAGELISLGIVCPGCGGGRYVRKVSESYFLPGDTTIPKLVPCRFCMTYDADSQSVILSSAKLLRAVEAEVTAAQNRRRAAISVLEEWQ